MKKLCKNSTDCIFRHSGNSHPTKSHIYQFLLSCFSFSFSLFILFSYSFLSTFPSISPIYAYSHWSHSVSNLSNEQKSKSHCKSQKLQDVLPHNILFRIFTHFSINSFPPLSHFTETSHSLTSPTILSPDLEYHRILLTFFPMSTRIPSSFDGKPMDDEYVATINPPGHANI